MNKEIVRNYFDKFKKEPHYAELTLAFLLHEITNIKQGELTDKLIDEAYEIYEEYPYIFNTNFHEVFDSLAVEREEIERDI